MQNVTQIGIYHQLGYIHIRWYHQLGYTPTGMCHQLGYTLIRMYHQVGYTLIRMYHQLGYTLIRMYWNQDLSYWNVSQFRLHTSQGHLSSKASTTQLKIVT